MNYLDCIDKNKLDYFNMLEPNFPEWLVDYINTKELLEKAKEYLSLNNMTKGIYQKLIERIEIDKERNIFIKFKFAKYTEK